MKGGSAAVSYEAQISRTSLYWLLLAQFALVLPHVGGLPPWLFVVCMLCAVWRVQIYREKLPFASGAMRALLSGAALLAVLLSFLDELGLDATVTFLILVFFLKLLETRRARDMYVTLFLGYFVATTPLLYGQSLVGTAYAVLCYLLLTAALLSLHYEGGDGPGAAMARALGLMLQGLPLLAVLFLLFPRVDPLWLAPMPSAERKAGISEKVSLGSFGQFARSAEVAFRVTFAAGVPANADLYWRGLVLEGFDGSSWTVLPASMQAAPRPELTGGGAFSYDVVVEPTHQRWLFALPLAVSVQPGVIETADFTLRSERPLRARFSYSVTSQRVDSLRVALTPEQRRMNLSLPGQENPAARALGAQLRSQFGADRRIVDAVLARFSQEPFVYTLQPPAFATNAIDGFLFDSRQGYCEHYASAFVFLLRAAGVPTRMVGGYLGGEVNPFEAYLSVRQMDAHVWAEVWLEDAGWVRFDPTAQVAPERVLNGIESVLLARDQFRPDGLLGWMAYSDVAWLQGVRLWWDAVNYGWNNWVLNYSRADQLRWLDHWLGRSSIGLLAQVLVLSLVAISVLLLVWLLRGLLLRRRPPASFAAAAVVWLLGRLQAGAGQQAARRPQESMIAYCARVAEDWPQLKGLLADFAAVYSALAYADLRYHWPRRQRLHGLVLVLALRVLQLRLGLVRPVHGRAAPLPPPQAHGGGPAT